MKRLLLPLPIVFPIMSILVGLLLIGQYALAQAQTILLETTTTTTVLVESIRDIDGINRISLKLEGSPYRMTLITDSRDTLAGKLRMLKGRTIKLQVLEVE